MPIINDLTPNRLFPLPNEANTLKDDVARLRLSLTMGDTDIAGILTALANRSLVGHTHSLSDVTNLVTSLAGKSDNDHVHSLDDLSDVNAPTASSGAVLLWNSTAWIPAILQLGNVAGLEVALDAKASTTAMNAAIAAAKSELVNGAGTALDTLNELAAALGNDPNFATTMATSVGLRVLTTTYDAGMLLKADLASPVFTGSPVSKGVKSIGTAGAAQLTVQHDSVGTSDANAIAGITFNIPSVALARLSLRQNNVFGLENGSGTYRWSVDGSGNMVASGNVSAYSDARLKRNVKRIENALETLLKGQGMMFEKDGKPETGVIAQQLYKAIPELVNKPKDPAAMWSVKYGNALGYIIESFRDVVEMIDELRAEVRKGK